MDNRSLQNQPVAKRSRTGSEPGLPSQNLLNLPPIQTLPLLPELLTFTLRKTPRKRPNGKVIPVANLDAQIFTQRNPSCPTEAWFLQKALQAGHALLLSVPDRPGRTPYNPFAMPFNEMIVKLQPTPRYPEFDTKHVMNALEIAGSSVDNGLSRMLEPNLSPPEFVCRWLGYRTAAEHKAMKKKKGPCCDMCDPRHSTRKRGSEVLAGPTEAERKDAQKRKDFNTELQRRAQLNTYVSSTVKTAWWVLNDCVFPRDYVEGLGDAEHALEAEWRASTVAALAAAAVAAEAEAVAEAEDELDAVADEVAEMEPVEAEALEVIPEGVEAPSTSTVSPVPME